MTVGGAYDTVPEVNMLLSLFNYSDQYVPILFDEAGESATPGLSSKLLRIYPAASSLV